MQGRGVVEHILVSSLWAFDKHGLFHAFSDDYFDLAVACSESDARLPG